MIALRPTDVGRSIEAALRSSFPEHRLTFQLREVVPGLEPGHHAQVELIRDEFVSELGFRAGTRWRALDETSAARLLTSLLAFDLAYDCPRAESPLPLAESVASQFLALFGAAPYLFTNAELALRPLPARPARGPHFVARDWQQPAQHALARPIASDPLTSATFDCGVLVISRELVGCLWVEDED